jgi:hypothetical protein
MFFSWIIFPQATENNMWVILNLIENSRIIRKSGCTIGINDTGGKYVVSVNNIAAYCIFRSQSTYI